LCSFLQLALSYSAFVHGLPRQVGFSHHVATNPIYPGWSAYGTEPNLA